MTADAAQRAGLSSEQVEHFLGQWRPAVLRRMARTRLWSGSAASEREDHYQEVCIVLLARHYASEAHLRNAMWKGLGFRGLDFWRRASREMPSSDVGETNPSDAASPEEVAETLADARIVADCLATLSELERQVVKLTEGEGLSRVRASRHLGITEADLLRAQYSARKKIADFVTLLQADRVCAHRRPAIDALVAGNAGPDQLELARAHLARCSSCLVGFRQRQAALVHDLAAATPFLVAAEHHTRLAELIGSTLDHGVSWGRQHALALTSRGSGGGSAEAVAGAAGGLAIGTKAVATICATAAVAGGAAVCANSLDLLPNPMHNVVYGQSQEKRDAPPPADSPAAAPDLHDTPISDTPPAPPSTPTPQADPAPAGAPATTAAPAPDPAPEKRPYFDVTPAPSSPAQQPAAADPPPPVPQQPPATSREKGGGFFG